ncbi:MAG: VWA domain-containing protein [Anaerolineae bacterium]
MRLSFVYPEALWLLVLLPAVATLALIGRQRLPVIRRWISLLLRLIILAAVILALAGTQIVRPVDELTTIFLVDASDSVSPEEQARAEEFIRLSMQHMRPGDQTAVVVFGENALVERLPSDDARLSPIASLPTATRTNIGAAIQLGLALFPEDAEKRLVLLSDGQQNIGQARVQANTSTLRQAQDTVGLSAGPSTRLRTGLAAARGIEIDVVPLSPPASNAEVIFAGLHAPSGVRVGQRVELTAVIASTVSTAARLRVFGDNQLLEERSVQLTPGLNRFAVPLTAQEQGFRRYRAHIESADDTRPQNNQAAAFSIVHGPPRVLVVANAADEAAALTSVLDAAQLNPTLITPASLPTDLTELASYDTIVLVDVPAESLPSGAMETLPAFVRDLGHGLVMVGGETSYGAGEYLRTSIEKALPVDMDVRSRTEEPNVALVMAVDKSGSMGRCHCDDPRGPSVRSEIGIPKVDIAKQAVIGASSVMGRFDYLGVVAFDEKARWVLETQPLVSLDVLESSIAGFGAERGTNIMAGLDQAFQNLQGLEARIKHVILITDGWTNAGGYDTLVREMYDQGITLSIVAAGRGSADYLQRLAEEGGGRYYPATTMDEIPRIFLKETIRAVGSYIIEEEFRPLVSAPSPILTGLSAETLPDLRGYNGTTPKEAAVVALVSPQGDPVLAHWQYGLGRAVAWTSDLTGRWAAKWLDWADFPAFAAQLISWTLPAPQPQTLASDIRLNGNEAVIVAEAFDLSTGPASSPSTGLGGASGGTSGRRTAGRPRNFLDATARIIAPDLSMTEVKLQQTAAGRYEGRLPVSQVGSYLVQIQQADDNTPAISQTTGFVVPYSPEYTTLTIDATLLREIAATTGGRVGIEPPDAFAHTLEAVERTQPIWTWLLLAAAMLFPLDVAIRRVMVTAKDLQAASDWVRDRLRGPRPTPAVEEPLLGELLEAKQRAAVSGARPTAGDARKGTAGWPGDAVEQPTEPVSQPSGRPAPKPDVDVEPAHDPLERLRKAKERAHRRSK